MPDLTHLDIDYTIDRSYYLCFPYFRIDRHTLTSYTYMISHEVNNKNFICV